MLSLLKSAPHISSTSYKDKLVANQSHNYFFTQLSSINKTDLIDEVDNIHLGTPFIPITSEDKRRIYQRWVSALIIKVYKRTIGYKFLLRKLRNLEIN